VLDEGVEHPAPETPAAHAIFGRHPADAPGALAFGLPGRRIRKHASDRDDLGLAQAYRYVSSERVVVSVEVGGAEWLAWAQDLVAKRSHLGGGDVLESQPAFVTIHRRSFGVQIDSRI